MNDELVKEKFDALERRTNAHSEEIDRLKQGSIEFKTEIKNLCNSIKSFNSTLKIFGVVVLISLLVFLFYAIEKLILQLLQLYNKTFWWDFLSLKFFH